MLALICGRGSGSYMLALICGRGSGSEVAAADGDDPVRSFLSAALRSECEWVGIAGPTRRLCVV